MLTILSPPFLLQITTLVNHKERMRKCDRTVKSLVRGAAYLLPNDGKNKFIDAQRIELDAQVWSGPDFSKKPFLLDSFVVIKDKRKLLVRFIYRIFLLVTKQE